MCKTVVRDRRLPEIQGGQAAETLQVRESIVADPSHAQGQFFEGSRVAEVFQAGVGDPGRMQRQ